MKVLAFDTTGERLSVALSGGSRVRARRASPAPDQDEQLRGEVNRLLRAAGLALGDVDAFVAATGPGRFTGIRVGLTFAGMLARSLGKRAVGVSWLDACAWQAAPGPGLVVAVLHGWKGEFFFQVFERGPEAVRPARPPRWSDPDGLASAIGEDLQGAAARFVGPGALEAIERLPGRAIGETGDPLNARALLAPALRALQLGQLPELAPLYIKAPHYEK